MAVRDLWNGQFQGQVRAAEEALRRLHGAVRALEDPAEWWRRQEAYWSSPQPDAWLAALLQELPRWAAAWRERLELWTAKSTDLKNPNLIRRLPWLDQLAGMTSTPETRAAAAVALGFLQEQSDEEWTRGKKGVLREPLEDLFSEAAALEAWLRVEATGADPLREDWGWCRERMRTVLAWWRHFDAEYSRRKREQSAVDFADQEQFALELLGRGREVGRTLIAAGERDRFALVLVDECQDLNAAQDAILRAVARESNGDGASEAGARRTGNRFLVGDVKQSIYRFRFADPLIFQRYANDWVASATDDAGAGQGSGAASGRVLTLNENFRSAARVLEFVNGLFPWLLRPEMGGVDFGSDAALQFGEPESRSALAGGDPRVEMHVRATGAKSGGATSIEEGESGDDEQATDKKEAEATLIVARFQELHSQKVPVWDKRRREWRPVNWNDMVVLLRSKQSHAETFIRVFARAGVPLQASAGGFFSRREVRDLRNLVALFDNPLQDVPLLGVLRSAFAGWMTVDDLAIIRLARRRSEGQSEAWWTLLQHFVEIGRTRIELPISQDPVPLIDAEGVATISGADIFVHPKLAGVARSAWKRANTFLAGFAEWRRRAARGPLAFAVEAALDDTNFEAACRAQPDGPEASGNGLRFLELARQFDQRQAGGAAAFLEWLDAQDEAEAIAPVVAGGMEAVTLLTIHKSKGLEFPVVAVASLGGQFNERDWRDGEWILDADRCLAPRVHPPAGRPYPSPTL